MIVNARLFVWTVATGLMFAGFVGRTEAREAELPAAAESVLAPVPRAEHDEGDVDEEIPSYEWRDEDYEYSLSCVTACYDGCVNGAVQVCHSEPAVVNPACCQRCTSCRANHGGGRHDLFGGLTKLFGQLTDVVTGCSTAHHGCCGGCCDGCCDSCCEPDCGAWLR